MSAVEARAAEWLARKDRADWSADHERALKEWLAQSTAHRVAYLRLDSTWERADRLAVLRMPANESVTPPTRESAWPLWTKIAASIAILALGSGAYLYFEKQAPSEHRYATEIGARETLALSDGSKAELNTNTSIRVAMSGNQRTIWLDKGEAYFQVVHDPAHPFVVHAGGRTITDLGTKFSVRRDNDRFEVMVEDGRVRVAGATAHPLVQARGDVVLARGNSVLLKHETDDQLASDLSWRQGVLVFTQTALADAAEEFNRYNQQKLVLADAAAAKIRIGGSFEAGNIEAFVRLLQTGFGVRVTRRGQDIIISS
jgi:transmembrane sensor